MAKVKLSGVRLAFCNSIWDGAAEQFQGKGVARHSATYLIEPGSDNDKAIWAAIKEVAAEKWPKKAQAMIDNYKGNSNKFCYMSGDLKDYDGFQGMMALGGHRKQTDGPPLIIDRNKAPLKQADGKIYGGCYVNATVDIYAQDGEYAGFRCGLLAIQFDKDGDSFGGAGKGKSDDFDDLGDGADSDFDTHDELV